MSYFTIGTDIEVFGKKANGEHKALCGLVGGTKDDPKQVLELPNGFMIQEDNVSLEFNIPPTNNKDTFVGYIRTMNDYVNSFLKSIDMEMSDKCSFSFSKEELKHPKALVFGCEPDFDAWKKIENTKPHAKDECLRTAGGHVHVGVEKIDMINGIRAMDLFLGVPSVILDDTEEAHNRRELYGKAGAMRPKIYGFEYRTLSNFWMFKDELVAWVYDATRQAMDFCRNGGTIDKTLGNKIQKCINTGDKKLAQELIVKYKIVMPMKQYKIPVSHKVKEQGPFISMTTTQEVLNYFENYPNLAQYSFELNMSIQQKLQLINDHAYRKYLEKAGEVKSIWWDKPSSATPPPAPAFTAAELGGLGQ